MKNKFLYSHNLIMIVQILIFSSIRYNKIACYPLGASPTNPKTLGYIKKSCASTLYPNICYESLSRYESTVKSNPRTLALTALSVAFNNTNSALKFLKNMQKINPGEVGSLSECVEEVGDSVYELHRSLSRLNHSERGYNFVVQMSDVQTWVSAALTDDDTCIDDFNVSGKTKIVVRGLILRIARLASVALAFINNYAGV
ncbi:pectinesterase inhibitor 10-like [Henckelia pumila]|uniref:pectinesterase inhibitor 10-like n=1 Tax=Henckelia pumila TaxID=405737 RepID=UPI003C6E9FA1